MRSMIYESHARRLALWIIMGTTFVPLAGCGVAAYGHKAPPTVAAADAMVGGLTDEDKQLYKNGLAHIRNVHSSPGAFTILEVIDQERARESKRQDQQAAQKSATDDRAEEQAIKAAAELLNNRLGFRIVRAQGVSDAAATLEIDADYWDNLSHQDQDMMFNTFLNVWGHAYAERHHGNPEGATLVFKDMAGNQLHFDVVAGE